MSPEAGLLAAEPAGAPARPVYVFDLDGTVLDVNSFPLWVRAMLAGGSPAAPALTRARVAVRAAAALVERKLLKRPHKLLKLRLQQIWAELPDPTAADDFAARLEAHVRPEFRTALGKVASGEIDAVLATAAAEEYAAALARRLGFRHCLATPRLMADVAENVGEAKRASVAEFVAAAGWGGRPLVVFTDHLEDAPLARTADILVWCGDEADGRAVAAARPCLLLRLDELDARGGEVWS